MIVKTVPCGVHPLHFVKVHANGARSGCPMCAMQVEDLCRSLTGSPSTKVAEHAPRITLDRTRIVGCTCGWQTPPGATDSDDVYAAHIAIIRAGAGGEPP